MGSMSIARKVTSDLKEEEITKIADVINESLYAGREPLEKVKEIFLSFEKAGNYLVIEDGLIIGASQTRYLEKTNSTYFKVAAMLGNARKKGMLSRTIDLSIADSRGKGAEHMGLCVGNPYAIDIFHEKGFPLPDEMADKQRMYKKAKEMLVEARGSDMDLPESFIIAHERFDCPDLANSEEAYSREVIEFVKKNMKSGDRLFMIKEL